MRKEIISKSKSEKGPEVVQNGRQIKIYDDEDSGSGGTIVIE